MVLKKAIIKRSVITIIFLMFFICINDISFSMYKNESDIFTYKSFDNKTKEGVIKENDFNYNSTSLKSSNYSYNIDKENLYGIAIFILGIFLTALIIIVSDKIKRIKIEKNLKESEERYKLLLEILPIGVVIHDENKIYYANKEGLRILGEESVDNLKNKELKNYVHSEYKDKVISRIEDSIKEKVKQDFLEQKIIRSDGSIIDIEASGGPISIDGITKSLSLLRDISERKHAKELENKIKAQEMKTKEAIENEKLKTEVFSNFSHELKTPLNLILGTIQLLEIKLRNDENLITKYKIKNKSPLNIMKQNCYRLLRLVNNIIDVTRIDAGYYNINLKNVNIISIVEEITLSVAHHIEQKEVNLTFDTEIEEKIIACDPDKIERIVLNILSNAIKFTNPGDSIDVNIYDMNDTLRISIRDTGIGIPEDKVDIIMKRFGQVDKHYNRNKQGSGIGLSLVNSLIELHGGSLSIKSECNKGSEFIIDFPVRVLENEEIEQDTNLLDSSIERICIEFSDIYS